MAHVNTFSIFEMLLTFYDRELEAVNIDIKIKKNYKFISTIYKKIYYFVRWNTQTIYLQVVV